MKQCKGCKKDCEDWELALVGDEEIDLCMACTYEYEVKADDFTENQFS